MNGYIQRRCIINSILNVDRSVNNVFSAYHRHSQGSFMSPLSAHNNMYVCKWLMDYIYIALFWSLQPLEALLYLSQHLPINNHSYMLP